MIPDTQYPSQNHGVTRNAGFCCNYLLKFEFLNPWALVGTYEIRLSHIIAGKHPGVEGCVLSDQDEADCLASCNFLPRKKSTYEGAYGKTLVFKQKTHSKIPQASDAFWANLHA